MYEIVHEKVKKDFKLKDWQEKFTKAKEHRASTYDSQARRAIACRENESEIKKDLPNIDDYNSKIYQLNTIWKINRWIISYLTGSDVSYDLESTIVFRDENTEILENELNRIASMLDITRQTTMALSYGLYTGMGYVRRWWDKYAISLTNKTGEPKLEYVSAMKMYIDEKTQQPDKADMRHIFHVERFDYEYLSELYPEFKKEFEENKDVNGTLEHVTVQFKINKLVEIEYRVSEKMEDIDDEKIS